MRRLSVVIIGLVVILIVARLTAQSQPDFSGKWILSASIPAGSGALGQAVVITQDAATLTLDTAGISISGSVSGRYSETTFPVRMIFALDGAEHPSQVIADRPLVSSKPVPSTAFTSRTEESISRASWAGRQLVIMTYNKLRTNRPNATPATTVTRQTVRRAFTLEADGSLVVESLIVADPLPFAPEQPSPTPVRSVYRKG
jgi:hypothetical protein